MMNILITGANGQLGNEMRILSAQHPNHTYFFSDITNPTPLPLSSSIPHMLDITDLAALQAFVQTNKIDLIVNCAAYTNVDKAEQDEPTARLINAQAVENLGSLGCKVIHISTDYVFAGDGCVPGKEDDPVDPKTAYGRTKYEGEQRLLAVNPEAVILRTAWLYSPFGNNFVKTMLRLGKERDELKVVYDQVGSPTYALDLAAAIFAVIEAKEWHKGIYHFTNEGVCSWYDFTVEILRQAGVECKVTPILSSEYQYRTPRPHYSVLDKAKIKETFGIAIPYWTDSLRHCLQFYLSSSR
ncbi:MAG: dTDP-4-dehydrorhamnose reductase [Paludibacteraceae bacterium]|nr:dTDP-4-dehydrorhamnose reductase [Paludibacteraceae bacterium]